MSYCKLSLGYSNNIISNNFDDFLSAMVLLWDLLVVNNWHVFLHVFRDEINTWAQLYFICWWLTSAVVILNIFVALILDNFIVKWDIAQRKKNTSNVVDRNKNEKTIFKNSLLEVYKDHLKAPDQDYLNMELQKVRFYFNLQSFQYI